MVHVVMFHVLIDLAHAWIAMKLKVSLGAAGLECSVPEARGRVYHLLNKKCHIATVSNICFSIQCCNYQKRDKCTATAAASS